MARVPTWTELRLDATKLASFQKQCNESVHILLDSAIPELDRKISYLYNNVQGNSYQVSDYPKPSSLEQNDLNLDKLKSLEVVQQKNKESDLGALRPPDPPTKSHKESTGRKHLKSPLRFHSKRDLDELEHLKPLPRPLSEYLRINRPEIVERANERVIYLRGQREKLEREKISAPTKISSLFGQKRSSSRVSNDYVAPEYNVKHELSEKQIRQQTARNYKRLPEVERKCREEATKRMRVQYYKNKCEYGRKLSENRKRGIINYPLRATNDDSLSYDGSLSQ